MMNNTTTDQPATCSLCDQPAHRGEHLMAGLLFDPADLVCADCAESID